jgi:hypothetical protein
MSYALRAADMASLYDMVKNEESRFEAFPEIRVFRAN